MFNSSSVLKVTPRSLSNLEHIRFMENMASRGDLQFFKWFVENKSKSDEQLHMILLMLCATEHLECCKIVYAALKRPQEWHMWMCVIQSVQSGHIHVLEWLLQTTKFPECRSTCVLTALINNRFDIADLLVDSMTLPDEWFADLLYNEALDVIDTDTDTNLRGTVLQWIETRLYKKTVPATRSSISLQNLNVTGMDFGGHEMRIHQGPDGQPLFGSLKRVRMEYNPKTLTIVKVEKYT